MDDQQRARILYLAALHDLEDEQRGARNFVRYWAIFPLIVVCVCVLAVFMDLPPVQAAAVAVGIVPTAGITYVAWTNAHDDRMVTARARALELRLNIRGTRPPETYGLNVGDEIEQRANRLASMTQRPAIEVASPTPEGEKGT